MKRARADARKRGDPTYHGSPCARGHGTLRHTRTAQCMVCRKAYGGEKFNRDVDAFVDAALAHELLKKLKPLR